MGPMIGASIGAMDHELDPAVAGADGARWYSPIILDAGDLVVSASASYSNLALTLPFAYRAKRA